ncbi:MAG: PEGA domain-containing protein [Alphaproteobacteria bacterium]|nr:PEGA domain-containing protein [Alphaproteobacteria bacterium]
MRRNVSGMWRPSLTLAAATIALASIAGCATTGADGSGLTRIETTPPGALVRIEGFGECETPCVIEHNGPRAITIARVGYNKVEATIQPGDRLLAIALELAAPSGEVQAEELPPLN